MTPARPGEHRAMDGVRAERFAEWTCKTCRAQVRWIHLRDSMGNGGMRHETISVYADPGRGDGDVLHEGDGNGRRLRNEEPIDASRIRDVYVQHGPLCNGDPCGNRTAGTHDSRTDRAGVRRAD
jgi:hypothetical protein